nr:MAG TPA: hypothetical protein [Caudoviricetes sp.]
MIAIMLDIKCCVAGTDLRIRCETARVYVLDSPHFYSVSVYASTTTERALKHTSVSPAQWVRVPLICANTLTCCVPVTRPASLDR